LGKGSPERKGNRERKPTTWKGKVPGPPNRGAFTYALQEEEVLEGERQSNITITTEKRIKCPYYGLLKIPT